MGIVSSDDSDTEGEGKEEDEFEDHRDSGAVRAEDDDGKPPRILLWDSMNPHVSAAEALPAKSCGSATTSAILSTGLHRRTSNRSQICRRCLHRRLTNVG